MDTPTQSPDSSSTNSSRYSLTVEEAAGRFADGGVPRSLRTIQRYCKIGILDCTVVETAMNEQYLIADDSVARRIVELQQIVQTTGVATQRDTSRHDTTSRDTTRHDASHTETNNNHLERIKELEAENENLRFDVRMNRELANFVRGQDKQLITDLQDHSRQIGRLEAQLLALEGANTPERDVRRDDTVIIPTEVNTSYSAQGGDNLTS